MNLYAISQDQNTGYDVYDSAVVAAATEEDARRQHPDGTVWGVDPGKWADTYSSWCSDPVYVRVTLIGTAAPGIAAGVIVSSFNAG